MTGLDVISAHHSPTWRERRIAYLRASIAKLDEQIADDMRWLAAKQRELADLEAIDGEEESERSK